MHPMAPFITEELFLRTQEKFKDFSFTGTPSDPYTRDTLNAFRAKGCIVAPFPQVFDPKDIDAATEEKFDLTLQVLHAIRNIRAEMKVPPGFATDVIILGSPDDPAFKILQENCSILQSLVRIQGIFFNEKEAQIPFSAEAIIGNLKVVIPLPEEMKEKEKARLVKEKDKLIGQQNSARAQLANTDFITKAPTHLVEKLKSTLLQSEKELSEILRKLEEISP